MLLLLDKHESEAIDITHLHGLNDFKCQSCVEAKMKHRKPPRSIWVVTMPGEIVSFDATGVRGP
jgi:hypothetical protein